MFGVNLKPLLLQPPVKGFVTMGLDPGYRNGCKVAVVDSTGKVLDTAVAVSYTHLDVYKRQPPASAPSGQEISTSAADSEAMPERIGGGNSEFPYELRVFFDEGCGMRCV